MIEIKNNTNQYNRTFTFISLAVILLVSLLLRLIHLPKDALGFDEGVNLMTATLVNVGHSAYTVTFVSVPPVALLTAQTGVLLFGSSVNARIPMLLYSLIGVAAIYWIVREQVNDYAGLLAAILLSLNGAYFSKSTVILGEVPAIAMALLSVALVQQYKNRPTHYVWLFLSGAMFAISLMLKVFVVFLPLLIAVQLFILPMRDSLNWRTLKHPTTLRVAGKMGIFWLAGALLTLSVFLFFYDPITMYKQVIMFRILFQKTMEYSLIQNVKTLISTITTSYLALTLITLLGFFTTAKFLFKKGLLWLIWFILTILLLLAYKHVRERYFLLLLPPLAAFSGILIERLSNKFLSQFNYSVLTVLSVVLLVSLISPFHIMMQPSTGRFPKELPDIPRSASDAGRLSAAKFAQRITETDDCVIVDDQRFAFLIDRQLPPFLSETSTARLASGLLTAEQVIDAAGENDCPILFYNISDRFEEYLPDLKDRAAEWYSLRLVFAKAIGKRQVDVYAVPMNTQDTPSISVDYFFENEARLIGVDLLSSPWDPNEKTAVTISTYWQAQRRMEQDYKIFIHLNDNSGEPVATFDHYPFGLTPDDLIISTALNAQYLDGQSIEDFANYPNAGLIPTRLWIPGNTLKETLTVNLPEGTPQGEYIVSIGLYNEVTGERLTASEGVLGIEQDEVVVGIIKVID